MRLDLSRGLDLGKALDLLLHHRLLLDRIAAGALDLDLAQAGVAIWEDAPRLATDTRLETAASVLLLLLLTVLAVVAGHWII